MNDTHGENGKGWYGFDLDGTLAKYDGWKGIDHIGDPIWPMVNLMKDMHLEDKVVKIMTARVAPKENPETGDNPYMKNNWCIQDPASTPWALKGTWGPLEYIQEWCYRHLGFVPEVVYQKDHLMLELYDDRVKQVVPNEGWLVEDIAMSKRQHTEHTVVRCEVVDCKWYDRLISFLLGMGAMAIIVVALMTYLEATMTVTEAEQKLHDAIQEYMQAKSYERVERLLK